MECRIFFVGYSCNVRSSLSLMSVDDPNSTETRTIHCNWRFLLCKHHRVSLQLTSSLMAELFPRRLKAILSHISRSVPFLSCYYQYHRLRICARWPSSLPGASKFQRSCPFPWVYTHKKLRRGNIHQTLRRNSGPKFDMEANQPCMSTR